MLYFTKFIIVNNGDDIIEKKMEEKKQKRKTTDRELEICKKKMINNLKNILLIDF